MSDNPHGYRLTWRVDTGDKLTNQKTEIAERDFPTREAAEACKSQLRETFGDRLTACVIPIPPPTPGRRRGGR